MSDVKSAILDAKYIDMIEMADFVVRDCGLPDMDENGEALPQQNEIAAAIFRWAAGATLGGPRPAVSRDETTDRRLNGAAPGDGADDAAARDKPEDA